MFSFFFLQKSVQNEDIGRVEELVCNTVKRGLTVDRNSLPLHDALNMDGVVSLENEVSGASSISFRKKNLISTQ